jgi:dihydrofolate reductase
MRKVILQIYTSLDGFVCGPNDEMDWIFKVADDVTGSHADKLLNEVDVILLGRGMSKGFLDYWPKDTSDFAKKINALPKIVFSKTLKEMDYPDVTVSNDISGEIAKLKSQPGKNIILYGGAEMAQTFSNLGLIDEYHIMIAPVLIGEGKPLFKGGKQMQELKLVETKTGSRGVVVLHYEKA